MAEHVQQHKVTGEQSCEGIHKARRRVTCPNKCCAIGECKPQCGRAKMFVNSATLQLSRLLAEGSPIRNGRTAGA